MARQAEVIREGLRLADLVHRQAERNGWTRETYHVYMRLNTNLPKWRMAVVSDKFDQRTESDWFNDIMDKVDALQREDKVSCDVGLTLWMPHFFEFLGDPPLRDGEIEIPDELINPGFEDASSPSRAHSR